MKLTGNIALAVFARVMLYVLSVPLIICSVTTLPFKGALYATGYFRTIAIVLDIVGNVIGGPVWNILFFKSGSGPEHKFGGIITMSFVFAMNYDLETLNNLGRSTCRFLEFCDKGHLEESKNPSYLFTHYPFPNKIMN